MPSIQLTTSAIKELPGHVPDRELLMVLHMLRYRDSVGSAKSNRTGRQSFEHYLQMTRPVLMQVGGRPLWRGQARFVLLGPTGERWDEVMLFSYPSLRAFERFVDDERHQAGLSPLSRFADVVLYGFSDRSELAIGSSQSDDITLFGH